MKTKNLLILALAVAALAAWVLLVERHRPTTDELRERADRVFPDLERDDVTALAVRDGDDWIRLAKRDGEWWLEAPLEYPAAEATVSSALGSLLGLRVERRLAGDEVDPAAYGLDEPSLEVELATADGGIVALEIGGDTALGSNRAVRLRGEGELLLTPGWFADDLESEVDAWRSKDVVDLFADQVAALSIVAKGDLIEVVRADDRWQLVEPVEDLADRDHLEGLVSDLNALTVEEFLPADADPAGLGLDRPEYRVRVIRADGDDPTVLELGATREVDGATQVAMRRDGRHQFWVRDTVRTRLDRAPVRWRSEAVYPFDTWDVDGLTIASGDEVVTLERGDGVWRTADGEPADAVAVSDRLRALADLEATGYDLVTPPTPASGRVELVLDAGELDREEPPDAVVLTFHAPLADGGEALVTVTRRDTVMAVPASVVESILADPDALLETPAREAEEAATEADDGA